INAYEQLKNGYSMIIFPEGTRSKGGPVKEFKAGSFKPAIKAKVPIVPITLDGTYKVIDGDKDKIDGTNGVQVVIHQPIETADLTKEEIKQLPAKVYNIVTGCMKYTKNQ
ncbi:MAG: 1-acyl-sn-glycerol-3-phosphate acyltransferase, partial [Firmicutes bacterium]|nr:1-acyl-sn-glycerol-3-phosphate acyltransferase [Bacillota bacterium]